MAPLGWALALYAIGWLGAQRFAHAVFPRLRLEYGEAGGELGPVGALTADAVAVAVLGVTMDGIHVRRSSVMIENCKTASPRSRWVQGIDRSFSMDKQMSMVNGCTIVTHMTMGEMSMGSIAHNDVLGALGVGIICLDHSECSIEHNTVAGTRTDPTGDASRADVDRGTLLRVARAKVSGNTVLASPGGVAAFDQATLSR